MTYIDKRNDALASPAASYWLKNALRALDGRDPFDALNDAQALAKLAGDRVTEIEDNEPGPSSAEIQASEARLGA